MVVIDDDGIVHEVIPKNVDVIPIKVLEQIRTEINELSIFEVREIKTNKSYAYVSLESVNDVIDRFIK